MFVFMSFYFASSQDKPQQPAFRGSLAEVALAVAAQPNPGFYDIRFHRDGYARLLTPEERAEVLAARFTRAA